MRAFARRIIFLLVLIAVLTPAHAQTQRIAALQQRLAHAPDSSTALAIAIQLLHEHESLYKDSLLPLAQQAIRLAQQQQDKPALGYAYVGLINAFLRLDDVKKADSVLRLALPEYPSGNARWAPVNFRLRQAAVNILGAKADYEGAVKALFSMVQDAEKTTYAPALSRAFNELGVIAYNRNELDKALEYFDKVLSLGWQYPGAEQAHAYAWINKAMTFAWQERYDSALHCLGLAKPVCERIQNLYYLANAWLVEANVYKWSKRMAQAEAAMLRMIALRERTEGHISFSNEQLGLANFYVYAGQLGKAIDIYNEGLAYAQQRRAQGLPANYELLLHYYEGLAKSYQSIGDKAHYEEALQRIIGAKDSLYQYHAAEAIADMQTKYEVQKKETTIIAQKLDITRKNFLFCGSLILLGIVALSGWLLFRSYRRRSELRMYLLREEEKRRAAAAVKEAEEAERRRIAADLHDSLGSYAASIKSNADELRRSPQSSLPLLELLQSNAQQMVSLLSDTIWAMRKPAMKLSDISDRIKLALQRLRPNYPQVRMRVAEELEKDSTLAPAQAYHLFMMVQEAINNALRHSGCNALTITVQGGESWAVRISDDGIGMREVQVSAEGGNGLLNMKARAQSIPCTIEWQETGKGTEVIIQHGKPAVALPPSDIAIVSSSL
jgi:signal transduction histidine kinase